MEGKNCVIEIRDTQMGDGFVDAAAKGFADLGIDYVYTKNLKALMQALEEWEQTSNPESLNLVLSDLNDGDFLQLYRKWLAIREDARRNLDFVVAGSDTRKGFAAKVNRIARLLGEEKLPQAKVLHTPGGVYLPPWREEYFARMRRRR